MKDSDNVAPSVRLWSDPKRVWEGWRNDMECHDAWCHLVIQTFAWCRVNKVPKLKFGGFLEQILVEAHSHSILTCWPRKSLMILPPSWYTCDLHGLGSLPFQNCRFSVSPSSCVTRRIFGKEGVFRDNDPSNVLVMWWLLLDLVFSLVKWSKAKLDGMKSSAGHIVQKQAELAVPRCKWCINSRLCVRVQAFWRHARS